MLIKSRLTKQENPIFCILLGFQKDVTRSKKKIVALLHDVIEDTEITPTTLLSEGFPEHIVKAILSVTKQENENYDDFVKRCSANSIGKVVKIHDLEDNMDITRLKELTENDLQRLNKYLKAYYYLKGE